MKRFQSTIALLLVASVPAWADWVTATINTGNLPHAAAVNPATNKIYIANITGGLTILDGATNAFTTVAAGNSTYIVAVNPVTNKIYTRHSDSIMVIDGATNAIIATVPTGTNPQVIAVNPATNKIYVANFGSNNVTVIDGVTNDTTTVSVGNSPAAVAVNPATNRIYVANQCHRHRGHGKLPVGCGGESGDQ